MRKTNAATGSKVVHLFFVVFMLALPVGAAARVDPAAACDHAAWRVSEETGVPLDILRAITRTETGRGRAGSLDPWPWTVNMEGHGVWFDTADQAQVYVFRHFQSGARSFDIGCFQINYRWHGHAFNSIEEMFDPMLNARYAARFLSELYSEHGEWTRAVGAYHSRTQKYAKRYISRFSAIRRNLPQLVAASPVLDRQRFPLLYGVSDEGQRGSLVPLDSVGTRRLIDLPDGG